MRRVTELPSDFIPSEPTREPQAPPATAGDANQPHDTRTDDGAHGHDAPADGDVASEGDAAAEGGTSPTRRKRRRRKKRRPEGETGPDGVPATNGGDGAATAERPPRPEHDRPKQKQGRAHGQQGPHGSHVSHKQKGDRGERRGRRGFDGVQSEHQALTAIRALSQMADGLLAVEGVDLLSRPRFLDIQLRIPLDGKRDGARAAAQAVEQILKRVQEVRAHESALVPGSVYCYFHESAKVETARPNEPRQVFDGYGSTGRPVFSDFVTMAIDRKDPAIDQLLAGEDVVLTHVTMGRVLRTQQLAEFGKQSPVYKILGQVDAGLFATLGSDRKAAFSFQLLRGTTLEGKPRLRIHPVGYADLMDLADPAVPLLLSRFQQRLDAESLRLAGQHASGKEVEEEDFVLPLLNDLARQLSGMARRSNRRTQHANQRTEEGSRPTTKAYADAREAADAELLHDEVEGTIVVLGPKMRVHVFSPDAMHVTSLVMAGPAVGRRRQQGRWRDAEPQERGRFRIGLRKRLQEAEADAAAGVPAAVPAAAVPPVRVAVTPPLAETPPPVPPDHGDGTAKSDEPTAE